MSKKDDWTNCSQCENEFKVISAHDVIGYCPFCGSELDNLLDEELEEWDIDDIMEE